MNILLSINMDIKKEDRERERAREKEREREYEYIIKRLKNFQPVKIHTAVR